MANTTYQSKQNWPSGIMGQRIGWQKIENLIIHLDTWGLRVQSLSLNVGTKVQIVLNNPVPNWGPEQSDHLDIDLVTP